MTTEVTGITANDEQNTKAAIALSKGYVVGVRPSQEGVVAVSEMAVVAVRVEASDVSMTRRNKQDVMKAIKVCKELKNFAKPTI